jgi:hypothetical protein
MDGKPAPSFGPQNTLPGFGGYDQPAGTTASPYNPVQELQDYQNTQSGNPGFGNPMQSAGPGASFPGMQENLDSNRLKEMYAALQGQGQQPQPFTLQPQPFTQQPQPFTQQFMDQQPQQQQYDQFMQQFNQQPQQMQNPYTSQLQGLQNQPPVQPPVQFQQPQQGAVPSKGLLNPTNILTAQPPGMGQPQQPQQAPGMGQAQQTQQPQQAPGMGQPQQAKPAGGGGGGIM